MAKDCSFDIVSEVEMQEVDNAVNQTAKEIGQRFDFRNSKSSIAFEGEEIKIIGDDEYKLNSIIDILQTKVIKRGISIKSLDYGKIEPASQGTVRQIIKIKKGISKDKAKEVISAIKDTKLKVQPQIMDDQVRVAGKNKDDLQQVIAKLKQIDLGIELQFINFRS
ncbi:YajQ family cyclic di-GMP-binding protein [Dendrosporobacter sp. 1207_IL3150]|uniref:YajQ family cyclic di-GMP-binding protein n=1 Tax=Dendrosporobacter sp. 1207_IL3150 TaxID=3084054 RepID=UPI002FDB1EC4